MASDSSDMGGAETVDNALRLAGRNVVVVGATGGIGGAITAEALKGGARVLAVGRSADRLVDLQHMGALTASVDLADPDAAQQVAAASATQLGPKVDGLVLASGAHGPIGPSRDLQREALTAYLDEHLVSLVSIIAALAPALDRSRGPSIVALSGGGATAPRPRYTPYALGKVALVRLVENLSVEEPRWKVNAVAPGFVASNIHESSIAAGADASGEDPDDIRSRMAAADDPARASELVRFLLQDESAGISGRLISAVWDPWDDAEWQARVASDPALGRLRRIDGDQFSSSPMSP